MTIAIPTKLANVQFSHLASFQNLFILSLRSAAFASLRLQAKMRSFSINLIKLSKRFRITFTILIPIYKHNIMMYKIISAIPSSHLEVHCGLKVASFEALDSAVKNQSSGS